MKPPIYGLMAEFDTTEAILEAARRAYAEGYRKMDGYTPFPVHGLAEEIGFTKPRVPLVCLIGGLIGLATAYMLQYWINVIAYPLNIGGRPMHSWPSFIIVTFELTVLFAGIATFFGTLGMNGLPTPYHPVFNVERFSAASRDKFFLVIEAVDPRFDLEHTTRFLETLNARFIAEVPN
jgi:hypothetical protein